MHTVNDLVVKLGVSLTLYSCQFLGVDRQELVKMLSRQNLVADTEEVRAARTIFSARSRFIQAWLFCPQSLQERAKAAKLRAHIERLYAD